MGENNSPEAVDQAATLLHNLLEQQTRLADEKHRLANELAEQNRLERIIIEQKGRELELETQRIALDREVEKRRDARLNQVLERLIDSDEKMQEYVTKLVTTDDAFNEVIQWIFAAHRGLRDTLLDCLRVLYALLSRNQEDMRTTRVLIQAQSEMLTQQANLDKLQLDAARYGAGDVPLKLHNQIEATKARIEELEEKIQQQRAS